MLRQLSIKEISYYKKQYSESHPALCSTTKPSGSILWIRTPKCGGTSLINTLESEGVLERKISTSPFSWVPGGTHLAKYQRKYSQFFNKAWKFAIVRNPWDRAVSSYFHLIAVKKMPKHVSFEDFLRMSWLQMRVRLPKLGPRDCFPFITYWDAGNTFLRHSYPLSIHLADRNGSVDYLDKIYKFEYLQETFDEICNFAGIEKRKLPHVNKTDHKHYTEYYTDELRDLVAEKYRNDIVLFDYKFGE